MKLGTYSTRPAIAAAIAMLLVACSVSTPRNGVVAGSAGAPTPHASAASTVGDEASIGAGGAGASGTTTGASPSPGAGNAVGVSAGTTATEPGAPDAAAPGGTAAPEPASGSTVGLTADSIVISVLAGYSGPYGALFQAIADNGYGLWADEINDHGGINGRRIVLKRVDNHDTAEGGVAACKEVGSNGSFMAISLAGLGGADISSAQCLDDAGIPVVTSNLAGFRDSWRYVISAFDAGKQAVPLASFIQNVIGDGAGRIGLIVLNDPIHLTGRESLRNGLAGRGMSVAHEETISPGQGSFVAELSRMRDAGATTVAMLTGNEAIGIVRDAKAIGYAPHWTGVFWTLDEFSQVAAEVWDGIQAIRGWPTTESPAYQEYVQRANHYGRTTLVNSTVMAVYGHGRLVGDIVARAGPALTRESIPPAAEQLGAYDNGILSVSFQPGSRVADVAMFPLVCCNPDNTWRGTGAARTTF